MSGHPCYPCQLLALGSAGEAHFCLDLSDCPGPTPRPPPVCTLSGQLGIRIAVPAHPISSSVFGVSRRADETWLLTHFLSDTARRR